MVNSRKLPQKSSQKKENGVKQHHSAFDVPFSSRRAGSVNAWSLDCHNDPRWKFFDMICIYVSIVLMTIPKQRIQGQDGV